MIGKFAKITVGLAGVVSVAWIVFSARSVREGSVNTAATPAAQMDSDTKPNSTPLESNEENVARQSPAQSRLDGFPVYRSRLFSDTPIGRELTAFFSVLDETGDEAGRHYEETLKKIKSNPKAAQELLDAYARLSADPTQDHYKILYTLGELRAAAALPLLVDVATTQPHSYVNANAGDDGVAPQVREATLIRLRAITGLRNLAADGNARATNTLIDVARDAQDLTVRQDAIASYLAVSSNLPRDIAYLKSIVPRELHYMVSTAPNTPTLPQSN